MLTTSIVVFTFFLFLRELSRQLIQALLDIQDDEDEDLYTEEEASDAEEASHHDRTRMLTVRTDVSVAPRGPMDSSSDSEVEMWDDGGAGNGEPGAVGHGAHELGDAEAGGEGDGAPVNGTPPAPSWVTRLATGSRGQA